MEVGSLWSYELLKTLIAEEPTTSIFVEEFKRFFADEIDSPRRMECIRTTADLIDCLERQDVLSEDNIDVLKDLADGLNNEEIRNAVAEYIPRTQFNSDSADIAINQYAEKRLAEEVRHKLKISTAAIGLSGNLQFNKIPNNEKTSKPSKILSEQITTKKREAIYKLIAKEIGSNWRSFGRELCVCEGDMDEIELQYPRDLPSRVYKLFQHFEEDDRHNPKQHVLIICKALDDSRRKDIRRGVEAILSH